jgi:lauroyl/myristoyl acyltransferase
MKNTTGTRTRRMAIGDRPLFTRDDASFLLEFPVLFATVSLVPETKWHRVAFRLEQLKSALARFSPDRIQRGLKLIRGGASRDDALRVAATRSEHHMQIVRDYFWGWRAPLAVEGADRLRDALDKGKGAVLWVAHFSFNALAAKKALHEAGFQVSHLSRPEHGFSKSEFGVRFLNPLRVRTELKYLRDRIIIDRARPAAAVNRGQKRLKENGIISVTAGAWEGARVAAVEVQGCLLDLSTGAPGLALLTGATLLPVFTVREADSTRIRVVIDKPIDTGRGADKDEKLFNAAQEFADRTKAYVAQYPFQWRDWEKVRPLEPLAGA